MPRIAEIPREEWDALVSETSAPFVEHTWLSCLEEAGCTGEKKGWIPQHLALYEGKDLVAAAPAYVKTNSEGEFVFDYSWGDLASRLGLDYYPKLVVAVPFTPASGDRLLCRPGVDRTEMIGLFTDAIRQLVKQLELSSAHVLFPCNEEAKQWTEAGMMLRYGIQYHWHNKGFKTFEDFLATQPSKKRTQVRRERKQPAMDGMTLHTLRPEELTKSVADEMHTLYGTTVDKYHYGRRYLNRTFFELIAERFAHRLAWVVAKKGDEIVASAFNIKKHDTLYGRYWGTHVDAPFLHFNVCFYHGIDQAIREGLQTFNPGAGGEHKRVRGFEPTITSSAHYIADPRFRQIVTQFLDRERKAIEDHVASGGRDDE